MVFGYGKMGQKHVHSMKNKGIDCKFCDTSDYGCYDPEFDHAIIATPIVTHSQVYKRIRKTFDGPILLEKPAVIYREQFYILDDVFVGLVERYNPVVNRFKEIIRDRDKNLTGELVSLEFTRLVEKCAGDPFFELAIHDIDLMVYLLDLKSDYTYEVNMECRGKVYTSTIYIKELDFACHFSCGESKERAYAPNARQIHAVSGGESIVANLKEDKITRAGISTVDREQFPHETSLFHEHNAFFANEPQPGIKLSHDLMLRLLEC